MNYCKLTFGCCRLLIRKKLFFTIAFVICYMLQTAAQKNPYAYIPFKSIQLTLEKSKYIVFEKSGKKEIITANYKFSRKGFYLKTKENKIYSSQTDSVFRVFGLGEHDTLKGYFMNKQWLFKITGNYINGYTLRPTIIDPIVFYKKDTLLLADSRKFKKRVLKEWVSDDLPATKLWQKQHRRYIIKRCGPPALLIGFITIGVLAKPDSPLSLTSLICAIPAALVPLILDPVSTEKIVSVYNKDKMINSTKKQNDIFKE